MPRQLRRLSGDRCESGRRQRPAHTGDFTHLYPHDVVPKSAWHTLGDASITGPLRRS
jgi:hypothetical protein